VPKQIFPPHDSPKCLCLSLRSKEIPAFLEKVPVLR